MDFRDLAGEAAAGLLSRPVRAALTTLGTVLGITTLVVTLGVAATAGNQIVGRFGELVATAITVEVPESPHAPLVGWTAVDRLTRLRGVESAAAVAESKEGANLSVRSTDIVDPTRVTTQSLTVLAATTGLPEAARGRMVRGRFYDSGHVRRGDRVAVLGDQAARMLGVTALDRAPSRLHRKARVHRHRGARRPAPRTEPEHRRDRPAHRGPAVRSPGREQGAGQHQPGRHRADHPTGA
ncbi:ABC transporter permease [Nonomuraea ferruginea]